MTANDAQNDDERIATIRRQAAHIVASGVVDPADALSALIDVVEVVLPALDAIVAAQAAEIERLRAERDALQAEREAAIKGKEDLTSEDIEALRLTLKGATKYADRTRGDISLISASSFDKLVRGLYALDEQREPGILRTTDKGRLVLAATPPAADAAPSEPKSKE